MDIGVMMPEVLRPQKRDILLAGLAPVGRAASLFCDTIIGAGLTSFNWSEFRRCCWILGPQSLPLVSLSAIFISIALTIQTVTQMQQFNAQDWSGAVIALGLLREIGPLTVSMIWCNRAAVLLADESKNQTFDSPAESSNFVAPRILAVLLMAFPLAVYGMLIGFGAAALYAPMLGVSTPQDFLEGARLTIKDQDMFTYLLKLGLVNPLIGAFVGIACGQLAKAQLSKGIQVSAATSAVTATSIWIIVANCIFTAAIFLH